MRWLIGLLGFMLSSSVVAWAAEKPVPKVQQAPVQIRSDELKVLQKEQRALFTGNVVARQGDLIIRCERLEVRYGGDEKSQTIERMLFSGSVDIEQGKRRGRCAEAEYDRPARRILCTGKPWVEDGPNRIRGELILFHLDRDEVEVKRPRAEIEVPEASARKLKVENP